MKIAASLAFGALALAGATIASKPAAANFDGPYGPYGGWGWGPAGLYGDGGFGFNDDDVDVYSYTSFQSINSYGPFDGYRPFLGTQPYFGYRPFARPLGPLF